MQYKIQSIIVKLAHAQGYRVGGDYALYMLGVPVKYLPRMDHLRLYGTSLDIEKFIKTLDVLYGVEILQKDMKPFVQKLYFRLGRHEKIHIYFSNIQESFIYSKDTIMLSNAGIEVVSTNSLSIIGAMQTLEMTKRRELSLLQNVLLHESHISSWDYISSQIDYVRLGWKIHPADKWSIYIKKKELDDCSICQNSMEDVFNDYPYGLRIKTACGHTFHYDCLKQWVVSGGDCGWKCPMCRSSRLILYKNCIP
jgi:hypothetical protein